MLEESQGMHPETEPPLKRLGWNGYALLSLWLLDMLILNVLHAPAQCLVACFSFVREPSSHLPRDILPASDQTPVKPSGQQ